MTEKQMDKIISKCKTGCADGTALLVFLIFLHGCFENNLTKKDVEDVLRENGLIEQQVDDQSNVRDETRGDRRD